MLIHMKSIALVIGLFVGISLAVAGLDADEPPAGASNGAGDKNIVYMTKDRDVWLDKQKKEVVLKGKVARARREPRDARLPGADERI